MAAADDAERADEVHLPVEVVVLLPHAQVRRHVLGSQDDDLDEAVVRRRGVREEEVVGERGGAAEVVQAVARRAARVRKVEARVERHARAARVGRAERERARLEGTLGDGAQTLGERVAEPEGHARRGGRGVLRPAQDGAGGGLRVAAEE